MTDDWGYKKVTSDTGNRTRAFSVKARNPNLWTISDYSLHVIFAAKRPVYKRCNTTIFVVTHLLLMFWGGWCWPRASIDLGAAKWICGAARRSMLTTRITIAMAGSAERSRTGRLAYVGVQVFW